MGLICPASSVLEEWAGFIKEGGYEENIKYIREHDNAPFFVLSFCIRI